CPGVDAIGSRRSLGNLQEAGNLSTASPLTTNVERPTPLGQAFRRIGDNSLRNGQGLARGNRGRAKHPRAPGQSGVRSTYSGVSKAERGNRPELRGSGRFSPFAAGARLTLRDGSPRAVGAR